jgi:hypothetical protein
MPLANSYVPPDELVYSPIQRREGTRLRRQVEIDALSTEPIPFSKNDDAQASHVMILEGLAAEGQPRATETLPRPPLDGWPPTP